MEVNNNMVRKLTYLVALLAVSTSLVAQEKKPVAAADFVGTWNIEMMSHQVALVIEAGEGNKVTATMMMMGNDVLLKGELVERTLTLTGIKTESATEGGHVAPKPGAKPITAVLQDDGTLAGEMMTNMGPVKWTGEKLKKRKQ